MLKQGTNALDFEVLDYKGSVIKLSSFYDKKLLLSFYRYASCPLCNLRIHKLISNYEKYQVKDLVVIAFFESPAESIKKYVESQEPPFSLIPDPDRKIYKKYEVEKSLFKYIKGLLNGKLLKAALLGFLPGKMENDKTMVPADFLIENGIIKEAYYGKDISDHIPFERIEEFLGIS